MDVDDVVEQTKVVKKMVVTLLEIEGEVRKVVCTSRHALEGKVAKLIIFSELVTQVRNFLNMLVKHSVQVILNREGLYL